MANEEYIHPSRYNKGGIEVWEIEKAYSEKENDHIPAFVEHLRFGALEYILRCWDKNGIEDLRKAANLLTRAVEELSQSPCGGKINGKIIGGAMGIAEILTKLDMPGEIHAKEES